MAGIRIKNEVIDKIKPMNAVNNGPVKAGSSQIRSNFDSYKAAAIPYARTHDASFWSRYGGEHCVDINAVFPDFEKDPYDSASYDFTLTDDYLQTIIDAGTQVFYRLGSKIEHWSKKYGTVVPKDFHKWAVICEHIIRHYNEGWADGFCMNIEYWEIWTEPDLDDDAEDKRTWGGTAKEFFDLYTVAAKHLKECFPKLKIGGPALAYRMDWAERFLKAMSERNVPIDFFSWHMYTSNPSAVKELSDRVDAMLKKYGYENTESILNEWNYVEDWEERFVDTIRAIIGMKGAAFTAAVMCAAQNSPVDMLMYYDARPCVFNGLFDFYTYDKLKTYYVFKMFKYLREDGNEIVCETDDSDIYALASADANGSISAMVSCYSNDDNAAPKKISVNISGKSDKPLTCFVLDEDNDCRRIENCQAKIEVKPNSVLFFTQKEL